MINISISSNLLIIISCFILITIIGLIVYIIYKDKMIDQEEIDDLIEDIVNAKPRDQKEEVKVTPIETTEPSKLNLEQMLNDMQASLDKKHNKIEAYEKEQDENAIISIRELEKSNINNIESYEKEQEDESIININEIRNLNGTQKLDAAEDIMTSPVRKTIAKIETNSDSHKFHNTDFISPIYGKMDNNIEYPKIKAYDKTADLELNEYFGEDVARHAMEPVINVKPLSNEIKRNTEFLNALKEFRSKLD